MSENSVEIRHPEPPKVSNEKRTTFTEKISQLGRRIMQFVKRPDKGNDSQPEQAFSPKGVEKEARKISPERARRISEEGCGVRAIMSAAAFASGERNTNATQEEWDARFRQREEREQGFPEEHQQDLLTLYKQYAQHDTPLGNALKQVDIVLNGEETEDMIKKRILSGEQVMVSTFEEVDSHIFHAGLDKKGHIISLSDQKIPTLKGKKFDTGTITDTAYISTFSVTPKIT